MPTTQKVNYIAGMGFILIALGGVFGAYSFVGLGIILIIIGIIFGWDKRWKCDYCDKNFKHIRECKVHEEECGKVFYNKEALEKHHDEESKKKKDVRKNTLKIVMVVAVIIIAVLWGIKFLINNKINLIPLFLISFILTPFFDKLFNNYKKKSNRLKHFEFNWWKKAVLILTIIFVFILMNLIIPECPTSCNDNKQCTNDFCSKETGYKCMNTIKLNCNGNNICESGEYGTSDCPNCDDGKKCTADSYDIGAKKCINVKMKGCTS